jgi:glycosyltransferase involved in cell wall biosynthesis
MAFLEEIKQTSDEGQVALWPRLLYLADVPVESSYHGSALLYRLLQNYPPDALRIVESGVSVSQPERRLARVNYTAFLMGRTRWLNTRLHKYISTWLSLRASRRSSTVADRLGTFHPEGVLTVAHGYGWLAAARLARERQLSLHLIVHDDWPRVAHILPPFDAWLDRQFGRVYCQARSRFCVSPFMRDDYKDRYDITGTVLYPSRAADCPAFENPPERLGRDDHLITVAFAGTINTPGYIQALVELAAALEPLGGQLFVFGPLSPEAARAVRLDRPNIALQGLLKLGELMTRMRAEADVLFVPMSFAHADAANMKMGFPSKLTDYTAIGLPLLIYGPAYCSAVRWARENAGVAEVVDCEDAFALTSAVNRLANDPEYRIRLARCALAVGNRYFPHAVAEEAFLREIAPQALPRT